MVKRSKLDFIGIGAPICGTTWLYQNLRRHPSVWMAWIKEFHYFDSQREEGVASSLFEGRPGAVCGEITPRYAYLETRVISDMVRLFPVQDRAACARPDRTHMVLCDQDARAADPRWMRGVEGLYGYF